MPCKILRLFVKLLTGDEKHSLLNRDNLTQPIQILVSQKENTFSRLFSGLQNSELHFEHFQKRDDPHGRCISEMTDSTKSDYINA